MKIRLIFQKLKIFSIYFFLIAVAIGCSFSVGYADVVDSIYTDEVYMLKGELVSVKVYSATQLAVVDESVIDLVDEEKDELLILGKSEGETTLFIWDEHGKRTMTFFVAEQMLEITRTRIKKLLDTANIHEIELKLNEKEGKVIALGNIPEDEKEQFSQIIDSFGDKVINLVKDDEVLDLIQIDLQVTELSTSVTKNLGIEWSTGKQTDTGTGSFTTKTTGSSFSPSYLEKMPLSDGSIGDYFKIGKFFRSDQSALVARINALYEEGKAKVLSRPKLVVVSGEEASFLVGGEIPIRTTSSSATGTQENVSFKSYGISMSITPTIKKEKIDMQMNVEISDIDAANASNNTVAFTTRSTSTRLYLDNGQTIILAGLIKHNRATKIKKLPFVSSIPIVGLLFRSKSMPTPDLDQEMVISVTPHILARNRNDSNEEKRRESLDEESGDFLVLKKAKSIPVSRALPYYAGVPQEMKGYIQEVQKTIAQAITYPEQAQEHNWEGTVKLGMLILNDGTLAYALVKESSGHEIFDEDAIRIAKSIAPYKNFPSNVNIQELNIMIPIVYKMN